MMINFQSVSRSRFILYTALVLSLSPGARAWATVSCPAPGVPAGLTPSGGASFSQDAPPSSLGWDEVAAASWYQVELQKDGAAFVKEWLPGQVFWTALDVLEPGSYQWRVRAWNPCATGAWSGWETFIVTCATLPAPSVTLPFNGQPYNGSSPTLIIGAGSGSASWFRVRIQNNGTTVLEEWQRNSAQTTGLAYDLKLNGFWPLANGSYTVQLLEWSSCYGSSAYSAANAFTVSGVDCAGAPGGTTITSVNLVHPPSSANGYDTRPSVSWTGLGVNSPWYRLKIFPAGNPANFVFRQWTRSTTLEVPSDLSPGAYQATVETWNQCGAGPASAPFDFTVLCDAPAPVSGLDIVNAVAGPDKFVTLQWDALTGANWYQVWVNGDGKNIFKKWIHALDDVSLFYPRLEWSGGTFLYDVPLPVAGENYEVWVRGWTACGGNGAWSDPVGFSTPCPALTPPVGLTASALTRPVLAWDPVPGADAYVVWINCNGNKYHEEEVSACGQEVSGANSFSLGGDAQSWQADDDTWALDLPFLFPFCGQTYSNCWVDSNGRILFNNDDSRPFPLDVEFFSAPMVAGLWDDLETDNAGGDIFVSTNATEVTVRWQGAYFGDTGDVNFSITLHDDGRVVLRYGSGNAYSGNLIGISNGAGKYILSRRSGLNQDQAQDITFTPGQWHAYWNFPLGTYDWWVRPRSACGGNGPWSAKDSFLLE